MPSGRSTRAESRMTAATMTGAALLASLGLHAGGLLSLPAAASAGLLTLVLAAALTFRSRLAPVTASPGRGARGRS